MRADLAAIRVRMDERWLDEERAQQVRVIVRDALADSATHASFRDGEWSAGYSNGESGGVYLRAADGSASLNMSAMMQVRFVASSAYGSDPKANPQNTTRWGLEDKLVFVALSGNLYDPTLTYLGVIAYTTQTNRFIVVQNQFRFVYGRIRKDLGEGWAALVGLQNVPWDLESDYIGSSTLTSGDYSIFNYRFGVGKQAGLGLTWTGESVRFAAGTYSQVNSAAATWDSTQNLSFAVASRVEAKWGIEWEQIARMSGSPDDSPGVVLGLGTCMSNGRAQNPQPPATLATPSAQGVTCDARLLLRETVLIAQYAYMRDPADGPELGWYQGVNLQASTFVAPKVEAFAEACWMGDVPVEWIAQAGANWFIDGNRIKLTMKAVVPFGGGNVNGIRSIAGGLGIAAADNNASFVTQLQVKF